MTKIFRKGDQNAYSSSLSHSRSTRAIWRANVHVLFIRLIVEGYKTTADWNVHHDYSVVAFRHWEQPQSLFVSVLGSSGERDSSQIRDQKKLQELCESSVDSCSHLARFELPITIGES